MSSQNDNHSCVAADDPAETANIETGPGTAVSHQTGQSGQADGGRPEDGDDDIAQADST